MVTNQKRVTDFEINNKTPKLYETLKNGSTASVESFLKCLKDFWTMRRRG